MIIQAVGDSAIRIEFEAEISPELNRDISSLCMNINHSFIEGVMESVPTFNTVTVYYDPIKIDYKQLKNKLVQLMKKDSYHDHLKTERVYIPVFYGGEFGPDLERVAKYNELTTKEVIERHQNRTYFVYMIGFLPGFPYLGGLDRKIATPRLKQPRRTTFKGAVGIAHEQTGIYPIESPGGWNIIGKTPVELFNYEAKENAFLLQAGQQVRFYRVCEEEYLDIEQQVKAGSFHVRREIVDDG
ncbi:5-oxoprolinase subunit PxpB [Bacillaceae bacterium W0354]